MVAVAELPRGTGFVERASFDAVRPDHERMMFVFFATVFQNTAQPTSASQISTLTSVPNPLPLPTAGSPNITNRIWNSIHWSLEIMTKLRMNRTNAILRHKEFLAES